MTCARVTWVPRLLHNKSIMTLLDRAGNLTLLIASGTRRTSSQEVLHTIFLTPSFPRDRENIPTPSHLPQKPWPRAQPTSILYHTEISWTMSLRHRSHSKQDLHKLRLPQKLSFKTNWCQPEELHTTNKQYRYRHGPTGTNQLRNHNLHRWV